MEIIDNSNSIKDSSDEEFVTDVVEASKEMPIIVDFWAPWCGPCKTLGPALENAVKANSKKLKLVKIDIDKYPAVASQLRVQSIPAVFAFSNGQPVDGFMGAQTPAKVSDFVKKIIENFAPKNSDLENSIATAEEMLLQKDYTGALEIFKAIIIEDINLAEAHAGLIKCFLGQKDILSANETANKIPIDLKKNASVKAAIAQIQLAEQTSTAGNLNDLKQQSARFPNDFKIKFDLAISLISEEEHEEAINVLLNIISEEPEWNEGKAKTQLIELLDSLGPTSQEGRRGRRILSSIIFS